MTAEYISKRCGTITVRTDSNQMPQQPLFSPVYNSTRPYSITRSATQRLLMMPDEIMQLDNKECLILIRGRRPLRLRKIIVEEMPEYPALKPCRVVEHIPAWRDAEAELERKRQAEIAAKAATPTIGASPTADRKRIPRPNPECTGQQTVIGWKYGQEAEPVQEQTALFIPGESEESPGSAKTKTKQADDDVIFADTLLELEGNLIDLQRKIGHRDDK